MKQKSQFILVEGTDGSGKATQAKLLARALRRTGKKVVMVDFPQYGQPSAWLVEQYLNGRFGSAQKLGAYVPSLFYALDRFEASARIRMALKAGKTVIANRYTLSNAAHQGGKISSPKERHKFWYWLFDLEYNLLHLPKPDVTIILHVPPKVSQQLVDKKSARVYTHGKKRDLHEADLHHLKAAERAYLELAKIYRFKLVECINRGQLLSPSEIHAKVWEII